MRKKQASNSLFSVNVELMLFGLCWVYLGRFGSDVRQVLGQSFRAKNYIRFRAQKKSLQTAYTLLMLSSCWASIGPCWAYLGYVGSFLGNLEAMSGKSWAKAFALRTTYFLAPKRKPSNSSYWVNDMLSLCWASIGPCLADVSYWICLYWCVRVRGFYELCHLLCWPRTWNPWPVSRMRSTGSRFTLHGGLWVEGVLARRCATVRNHPREGRMAVLLASSAKAITFWRLQTSHSLVSRGRHGTLWHANMFHNMSKVAFCDMHNTSASFSDFFVAGAALWWSPWSFCVVGAALGHDVLMSFANRIVRAVQIAWQALDIVRVSFCHFPRQSQYLGHFTLYTPHSIL